MALQISQLGTTLSEATEVGENFVRPKGLYNSIQPSLFEVPDDAVTVAGSANKRSTRTRQTGQHTGAALLKNNNS